MEEKRHRNFGMVLYPESTDHSFKDVQSLIDSGTYKGCYIYHDPESEEKEGHYHTVIKFNNAKTISAVSKLLNVPTHRIKPLRDMDSYLLYMVHFGYEDKKQYELEELKGDPYFRARLGDLEIAAKSTDEEVILDVVNYIETCQDITGEVLDYRTLLTYICKKGYLKQYKRYYIILRDLIKVIKYE